MNNMIRFGPSGNSESFYAQGYKSSLQMPQWLKEMGLNAYEYSCTRGVNIKEETAIELGKEALKHGIALSIHAPYYINLGSQERDKQDNSKKYILDSLQAARWMGAARVVFHPGSCSKMERKRVFQTVKTLLGELIALTKELGLDDIHMCPETMGKKNQLGTLDEVLELCSMDEGLIPTVDFGHIHALGQGAIKTHNDYEDILNKIADRLGTDRAKNIHIHFSRIEFTQAGEKKHWTLADTEHGPEFEPLAELLYKRSMTPVIICESRGTMAEDALKLKHIYKNISNTDEECPLS